MPIYIIVSSLPTSRNGSVKWRLESPILGFPNAFFMLWDNTQEERFQ